MKLHIYKTKAWGFLVGSMENNQLHKHYAIQLSIVVNGSLVLRDKSTKKPVSKAILIQPNVPHFLESKGENLHLFFNPYSRIGLFIQSLTDENIHHLHYPWIFDLIQSTRQNINGKAEFNKLVNTIEKVFEKLYLDKISEHRQDDRIQTVLNHLHNNRDRLVTAEECAKLVYLSKSRFLHYFREKTGATFKRAQLWIRIIESILVLKERGISAAAYQNGFVDNAHYCKTFKENLGFTPKTLINSAILYNTLG